MADTKTRPVEARIKDLEVDVMILKKFNTIVESVTFSITDASRITTKSRSTIFNMTRDGRLSTDINGRIPLKDLMPYLKDTGELAT